MKLRSFSKCEKKKKKVKNRQEVWLAGRASACGSGWCWFPVDGRLLSISPSASFFFSFCSPLVHTPMVNLARFANPWNSRSSLEGLSHFTCTQRYFRYLLDTRAVCMRLWWIKNCSVYDCSLQTCKRLAH